MPEIPVNIFEPLLPIGTLLVHVFVVKSKILQNLFHGLLNNPINKNRLLR